MTLGKWVLRDALSTTTRSAMGFSLYIDMGYITPSSGVVNTISTPAHTPDG